MRIESPNGAPPAFRCERTILPDGGDNSALKNGRSRPLDQHLQALDRSVRRGRGTRARMCADCILARVAQAGWSTATTRVWPSMRRGRAWPSRSPSTTSSQRAKTTSMVAGEAATPSRLRSRGMASPTRRGPSPRRAASLMPHPASRPARRGPRRCPRAAATPVVRIDWPAGSSAISARLRAGSSSEKTSSSSSVGATGVAARTSSWIPRRRASARQRCSPWEAWVRASRPSSTMTRSSRCGPDGVEAAPQVVGPGGRQGVEQVPVPAPLVALFHRRRAGRPGQAAVRGADESLELARQSLARRHEHLAGVRQSLVPHLEGRRHVRGGAPTRLAQQGGALAQDPVGLVRRPRAFGVQQRKRVVEQIAPAARAAADQREVVGREDRARRGRRQRLAARSRPCG